MRSRYLACGLLALLSLSGTAAAAAEAPGGPRLAAVVFHPYPDAGTEVVSLAADGSGAFPIAGGDATAPGPIASAQPSWSADGSRLAFRGVARGGSATIFTVMADGSGLRAVPLSRKFLIEGDPVMAPDGRSVAAMRMDVISGHFERGFLRGRGSEDDPLRLRVAVWSLGIDGPRSRRLTPWSNRAGLFPSSFSPDGSHLAASEWRGKPAPRAVSVDLATGRKEVLAVNASEPVYAPDGRVAVVRSHFDPKQRLKFSTLLVVPAGGGSPQPLVRVRGGISRPSWDPSGQRIAFTRLRREPGVLALPAPNSIAEVNADGTCLTTVAKVSRGFFAGSAWQPGPGREAGPIVC